MKSILLHFTEHEHKKLLRIKDKYGLNWEDFILTKCGLKVKDAVKE